MSEEGDEGAGGAGLAERPHGASGARPCGAVAVFTGRMLMHTWQQSKVIRVCVCCCVAAYCLTKHSFYCRLEAVWESEVI